MSSQVIVCNWKMHFSPAEAEAFATSLKEELPAALQQKLWVAPTALAMTTVQKTLEESSMKVGSQNCHWSELGGFTGEISPPMLSSIGADFVIVGHSERRKFFGETVQTAAKRAEAALKANLKVIFCIGETLEERQASLTNSVLSEQIAPLLSFITPSTKNLMIAYEPVWAIGTGKNATTEDIFAAHTSIRSTIGTIIPNIPILYGGSVSPDNLESILDMTDLVAGVLVGGSGLDVKKVVAMCKIAADRG